MKNSTTGKWISLAWAAVGAGLRRASSLCSDGAGALHRECVATMPWKLAAVLSLAGVGASPLFVFLHIAKTGGTAMEHYLHRAHGDAHCSLRPKDLSLRDRTASHHDYAEVWFRNSASLLARCAVISGEFDWTFVDVLKGSTNRTVVPFTLLRDPLERVVSWYSMKLREFRADPRRKKCLWPHDDAAHVYVNGTAADFLEVLTSPRAGSTCLSDEAIACCLRTASVPRKCMEGGLCGQGRNLAALILAGVDEASVTPFDGDTLCRTSRAQGVTRVAMQIDSGDALLARAALNMRQLAFVGFTSDLSLAQCAYLDVALDATTEPAQRQALSNLREHDCQGVHDAAPRDEPHKYAAELPFDLRDRIIECNKLDVQLYRWARAAAPKSRGRSRYRT